MKLNTKDFDYMYGDCHLYALHQSFYYGHKVVLWLDYDYDLDKEVLVHAYLKLNDTLFKDFEGSFSSVSEREEHFEFNHINLLEFSYEDAKRYLESMGIHIDHSSILLNS